MNRRMTTRIVKIEKGVFAIEYKRINFFWFPWKTVDKTFKTKPKAEEYIRKHFSK